MKITKQIREYAEAQAANMKELDLAVQTEDVDRAIEAAGRMYRECEDVQDHIDKIRKGGKA